jgi:diadenosine tetraphosphate (Ap4A) HIT family hydrolase
MPDKFSKNLIKEYKYWSVYIHQNQSYLGRCIVWCKRKNALDLTDANLKEQKELFSILKKLKKALKKAFNPNWFNYAFLGNETRHLHGHFIPRYKKQKKFMNIIFKDELYGHNYKTNYNFKIPEEVLNNIKNEIKKYLK